MGHDCPAGMKHPREVRIALRERLARLGASPMLPRLEET